MKCPYCKSTMLEESRDEYSTDIQMMMHCEDCGRLMMAVFEFVGFYDEEDNPIEEEEG